MEFDYKPFFQEPAYGVFTIAMFFCLAAQYTPAFFIEIYAQENNLTSASFSIYLLPILNATSIIGRIGPNLIADRIGGLNILVPAILVATVLAFAWIGIMNAAGCIVFAALYGFCVGCMLSLPPFVISFLCKDVTVIGSRIGNTFGVSSFGLLTGPPIAAAILRGTHSWLGLQVFSAIMLALATTGLLIARIVVTGPHLWRKA